MPSPVVPSEKKQKFPLFLPFPAIWSTVLGALAALLAWKPLFSVVWAYADVASLIVAVSTAVIGVQYAKMNGLESKVEWLETKLSGEISSLTTTVRDGMRRVDEFAEASAKAQLTWDALSMKLVPSAQLAQRH